MGPVQDGIEETLNDWMLDIREDVPEDVKEALEAGLIANAIDKNAPPYQETHLSITHCNAAGRIVAGVTGKTFWNWLYLDMLWVDKDLRGEGLGSALVQAAEKEALLRGCHSAYLWTQDFEGADFYPRLGYKEFVVKADFPVGHTRTGFMKRIAA